MDNWQTILPWSVSTKSSSSIGSLKCFVDLNKNMCLDGTPKALLT